MLTHGILPDSVLSVLLVPVVKDKTGKMSSIDNYRPIALASVLSKVFERILLDRLHEYIVTTDNQFGFKSKHGVLTLLDCKSYLESARTMESSLMLILTPERV